MGLFEVHQLSIYRGGELIVEDMSFSVDKGQVMGLIGPNGAGKSTALGGILGFYPIRSGNMILDGITFGDSTKLAPDIKERIAYIPEQPLYYPDLTLAEHLDWKQRLWKRYRDSDIQSRMNELNLQFNLTPHLDKFPHECSKGTLQKLMIVSAFMIPFQLLIIDEPFIGLDIVSIRHLKALIEEITRCGAAIIVSTHILDSAEKMCSHFVLLNHGRMVHSGSLQELRAQAAARTGSMDTTLEDLFYDLISQPHASIFDGGPSD